MTHLTTFSSLNSVISSIGKEKSISQNRYTYGFIVLLYLSFLTYGIPASSAVAGLSRPGDKDTPPKAAAGKTNASPEASAFACPTVTFTAPAAATVTQCANTTINLSVSTTAKGPDAIQFVYFTSPLSTTADAYTATGGTVLGTVNSGTATTNTVSLNNAQLPDNVGTTTSTIYIYALLQAADGVCQVVAQRTIRLSPRPEVVILGNTVFCQGTTTILTAAGPTSTTYQWFLNSGTAVAGTTNPFTTPVVSTTTTYRVRGTLAGCVSDEASIVLTPVVCTPCTNSPTAIGGVAFLDFNSDGTKATTDAGVNNVTVTLFSCDASGGSVQIAQMPTDLNGAYSFTGLTAGTTYRVEFSNLPPGYDPTYQGTNNGTTVQFTKPGSCTTSVGLNQPGDYCQGDPKWVTGCYVNGLANSTDVALVSNNYSASGIPSSPNYVKVATTNDVGSTWGLAYSKQTKKLFAASYLKRHVGLADGPGFVYYFDFTGTTTPTASAGKFDLQGVTPANGGLAIDLGDVCRTASCTVSGGTSASYVLGSSGAQNQDVDAFAKVGTISYGDADVDEATGKLWLVNLNQKALISVDISGATLPGTVNQYPLSSIPGFPTCTSGSARPFALAFRNGKGYVGIVCDAGTSQNAADMRAYVLSFDPANPTAGLTKVLDFSLDYQLTATGSPLFSWNSWITTASQILQGGGFWPQPMLSDIEFTPDNSMIIGLRDRFADQTGPGSLLPNGSNQVGGATGDMLKACYVNGGWIMEGFPGGCPVSTLGGNIGVNGNGVFFKQTRADNLEKGSEGGLAVLPGTNEVVTTFIDPWSGVGSPPANSQYYGSQGLQYFNTNTGAITDFYRVYLSYFPLFGKANGLSDLQFLCNVAPIQIGNRVWRDDNSNGIQDPCEPAIPGAVVKLYDAAKTTVIASATTNAAGEYYFSSAATVAGTSTSSVSTSLLTYNTNYALVVTSLGSSTVVTGLSLTSVTPLTPGESSATNTGNTLANNDAKLDVVGGISSPTILLTTGGMGENNHTYDFGITVPPCAKPTLATITSQSICQGATFSFPLVSSIVSNTVTSRQWYTTNAAGTSFTAISGATSLSLTSAQAVAPTAGQIKYYALVGQNGLSALCSDTVLVNLYMKPTQTIAFTAPTAAAVTQCANTTMNLSVSTNAKTPDAVKFVYFTSPLASAAAAYTATGGTVLGTVMSGTLATNTVSLNAQLPDNVGTTAQTIYVYALLQSTDGICVASPADSFTLTLSPRPEVIIRGNPILCQGASATLTAAGPTGATYQWFFNSGTAVVGTTSTNPFTTSAISTTTTYRVRGTLGTCVSDEASIVITPVVCTSCTASPTSLGGTAYRDFNSDGAQGSSEPGMSNVTVTLFSCDANGASAQIVTMQTDINGDYSFTGLTAGTTYRVEFSNLPAGYAPTFRGTENGTTVQFTKPGSCSTNVGLNYPDDYCQTSPRLVTACFINGSATNTTAPTDVLVSVGYLATSGKLMESAKNQIGSVWGVTYSGSRKKIYTATFLKRHVGLKGDLGAVYETSAGTPNDGALFVTIPNAGTIGSDAVRGLGLPAGQSLDAEAFAKIGRVGLGGIDVSDDDKTLYVVNLNDKKLYSVDIDSKAILGSVAIPSNCDANTGQTVPFAVKAWRGKVYVGTVCDASISKDRADLAASVFVYDPATSTFSASPVLIFPLDYQRQPASTAGFGIGGESYTVHSARWYPWLDVYDRVTLNASNNTIVHPTPALSDIDFDAQGNMILGFFDRMGHQMGVLNLPPDNNTISLANNIIGGELLKANATGNSAWTIEYLSKTTPFETFDGEFTPGTLHFETSQGGVVFLPAANAVAITAMDPLVEGGSGGLIYLSNTTGDKIQNGIELYTNTAGTFGKSAGLGDLVALCDLAPIQIGNRVWRDDNSNGIQDPCEPAIPGAVVKLYDAAKTTVIASATTNAAGEYYFSSATVVAGTSTSAVSTSLLTNNTTYGLVITSLGTSSVVTGLSLTNVSPLTPGESGTLNSGNTLANNDAKVDVVGGLSLPCIKLTTGDVGENNHTYDFGITVPPCAKPTLATIASQSICQGNGAFSFPLVSSIVSNTVTGLQWYTTNAAGTSFTAISGATSLSLSAAQAVAPTAGQIKYYALVGQNGLPALCSDTVFVNLYQKATQTITFPITATTVCGNAKLNTSVTTNAKAPDAIKFVYFTSPLTNATDAYTATGGTVLGTVTSGTLATNTVSLSNIQLPDNVGATAQTLYVYALLESADGLCLPTDMFTLTLNPRPSVTVGGPTVFCQGTTSILNAGGPTGTTYQWFLNSGTAVVGTANPFTTPVISTTTTYRVRGTLAGCVSDDASIVLTPVVCTSCAATPTSVGGVVYRDFGSDGAQGANDPGLSSVTVTIFTCDATNQSTQVATMQTDINGAYSFTGLTAGTIYRVEFSNFPVGYDPTFRGTQNGTTVQFTQPGSCSVSLGLNVPMQYCQTNPKLVTPCYLDGAVTPNTTALNDVLVSINYDLTGKTVEATRTEIGATWGVAYARSTKQLYAGAFLKRHVGLKDGKLGQIYVSDFATAGTPTTPWLDVSTLPGIAGNWTYLTDAQRGLGNAGTPTRDSLAFSQVAAIGLGDIDVSADGKTLYAMDLTNRQLLAIDIVTKTLIGKYPVPSVCATTPTTSYFSAGSNNTVFTAANGKLWQKGYLFDLAATSGGSSLATITNPNNVAAGTTDVAMYSRSAGTTTAMQYSFPVGNGTFGVKLHFGTNSTSVGRNMTVSAEGVAVPSLTNFDIYAQAGNQVNLGITRSFTATVTDGVLTLRFINNTGGGGAIVSGFELTPLNGSPAGETRPFGLAVRNGKVYVGAICDASYSQSRNDMQASVFEFNPVTGTYAATPTLTFALDYTKGPSAFSTVPCNNSWEPWTSVYPNNTTAGIRCNSFDIYTQPVLSDIEFDVDGSMMLGFFDRMGHQMGANTNLTPDGRTNPTAVVGGDILRAYFNGTSYELENNALEGISSKTPATSGKNTNEGPGGGEFYYGDYLTPAGGHQETSVGGLAYKPGAGDIRLTAGDVIGAGTGGLLSLDNTTGAKITANLYTLYSGYSGGVQGKSNGLGDLEILCDLAPIQIGNRVWRDDNQNGIQDPCEPAIPGAVVKLYDAAKTTVIASATTNAAGEYYFSSATVVAGTSTSSVSTSLLQYNTTYGLVITSLGNSSVVTGLTLTDVSPVTPGESGSINSGTSPINNDAKVDVVGGLSLPCIKLTTGRPGESNHTYDFGIVKFVCNIAATAQASSPTVCTGQPVTITALASPVGSYTYVWSAPAGVALTGGNTATATATASVAGLQTFTVTVSSSPGCFTTAVVSVSAVVCTIPPASLGDYVFVDKNKNGIQDAGDTPIQGVVVTLYQNGSPVATTTTDASGLYSFTGLTPGTSNSYVVGFTAPAGYTATSPLSGTDTTNDSNADPITGRTAAVTLAPGENNPTIDAGFYLLPASLGDYVWLDTNKNGQQDPTETGIGSVTAILCDAASGTVISTTVTDGAGKYLFTNLAPGSYIVKFTAPANMTFTTPNSGTDATDSDVASLTGNTGATGVYALTAGQQNLTVDAGLIPLTAGLGDYVFEDKNANGIQDAGDVPIPGVAVTLYTNASAIATTTTDANGLYSFTGLTPGTPYVVGFGKPAGYVPTTANVGTNDAIDSDASVATGLTGTYSLTANEYNPTVDAGFYKPASLGDYVFNDTNKDGVQNAGDTPIPGVVVTLYQNGSVVATTTTGATGLYSFTGLTPGTSNSYVVGFTPPAGYTATTPLSGTDATKDSNVDPITGRTAAVTLASGENNPTVDAGFYQPTASLGDYVWLDVNKNGQQDPTETGVGSVTVTLCDATSGTVISTTLTDSNGAYLFAGLNPGSYTVKFAAPANMTFTTPLTGGSTTDSNVSSVTAQKGSTAPVSLSAGENNMTIDAGLIPLTAGLGDYVFEDVNANGQQDAVDKPIAGVNVTLLLSGTLVATTTTDAAGFYSFTGLTPGVPYSVSFTAPAGFTATSQNTGADATDSDGNPATGLTGPYSLTANEFNPTVDMGYYKPASLGDKVFADNNRNGIQDTGDTPIPGVNVTLLSSGTLVATTTTDASGLYSFTGLTPGVPYSVSFTTPSSFSATTPLTGTDTAIDSNPVGGITAPVTLTSGENNPTIDAGFTPPLKASLGNYVWFDTNGNGQQDPTESGVSSVTAVLCDAVSGSVVSTTVTDATGKYLFTNLNPGSYIVKFTTPSGTTFTSGNTGGDGSDSDVSSLTGNTGSTGVYSLSAGEQNLSVAAGIKPLTAGLGDYVFEDVNVNGQQDAGDMPIPGVTVSLFSSGTLVTATTTDASGFYSFTGLTPGVPYSVSFTAPAGFTATSPNTGADATDSDGNPSTGLTGTYSLSANEYNNTVDMGYYVPVTGAPAYSIAKMVDLNRTVKGGIVTYTVSLTNTGSATGTNVVVTDQLSTTAVTFIGSATASAGTFTPAGNSGSWTIASLAPGQVATLALRVQLNAEGITYNTATAPDGQTATVCTSVPFKVCATEAFQINLAVPTGYAPYQWSKNGQSIAGATSNVLSATALGEYSVVGSTMGSCPSSSCCPFIIEANPVPSLTAVATAATCTGSTPLNDAKISLVSSSTNAVSYNITMGNSFTASAPLFATNQSLPSVGGVLRGELTNSDSAPGQVYTIRVYTADGCYADTVVTIPPALCNCPDPVCVPIKVTRLR
ncbi:SdrD B-like domain-containing protein [Fibrella aquatica]|uniref:SdrD B-like domain-containing protein n=1 Tax=Fibrella aquatica TaxID=3242487 RepID=UPI003520CE3C